MTVDASETWGPPEFKFIYRNARTICLLYYITFILRLNSLHEDFTWLLLNIYIQIFKHIFMLNVNV